MPHTGLPTLDAAGAYQVWSIVDGEPVTGGLFDIAEDGELTTPDGDEAADIWAVGGLSDIVITLEPYPDSDPAPADTHVAAGAINPDGTLEFDIDHPAVFGHRFDEAAGSFLLATPTNGPDSEELSGAWFLTSDEKAPSLTLPELPPGWTYEGWAVIDDTHVSTGRFTAADNNMFSGDEPGPDRPGEDFLRDAPEGLEFPTSLADATMVITVEPVPDNSDAPYTLKPLIGTVPTDAETGVDYPLEAGELPTRGIGQVG